MVTESASTQSGGRCGTPVGRGVTVCRGKGVATGLGVIVVVRAKHGDKTYEKVYRGTGEIRTG